MAQNDSYKRLCLKLYALMTGLLNWPETSSKDLLPLSSLRFYPVVFLTTLLCCWKHVLVLSKVLEFHSLSYDLICWELETLLRWFQKNIFEIAIFLERFDLEWFLGSGGLTENWERPLNGLVPEIISPVSASENGQISCNSLQTLANANKPIPSTTVFHEIRN